MRQSCIEQKNTKNPVRAHCVPKAVRWDIPGIIPESGIKTTGGNEHCSLPNFERLPQMLLAGFLKYDYKC